MIRALRVAVTQYRLVLMITNTVSVPFSNINKVLRKVFKYSHSLRMGPNGFSDESSASPPGGCVSSNL